MKIDYDLVISPTSEITNGQEAIVIDILYGIIDNAMQLQRIGGNLGIVNSRLPLTGNEEELSKEYDIEINIRARFLKTIKEGGGEV